MAYLRAQGLIEELGGGIENYIEWSAEAFRIAESLAQSETKKPLPTTDERDAPLATLTSFAP